MFRRHAARSFKLANREVLLCWVQWRQLYNIPAPPPPPPRSVAVQQSPSSVNEKKSKYLATAPMHPKQSAIVAELPVCEYFPSERSRPFKERLGLAPDNLDALWQDDCVKVCRGLIVHPVALSVVLDNLGVRGGRTTTGDALNIYWRLLEGESRTMLNIDWHPESTMGRYRQKKGTDSTTMYSRETAESEFRKLEELLVSEACSHSSGCQIKLPSGSPEMPQSSAASEFDHTFWSQCYVCVRPQVATHLKKHGDSYRRFYQLYLKGGHIALPSDVFRLARLLDLEYWTGLRELDHLIHNEGGELVTGLQGQEIRVHPFSGFNPDEEDEGNPRRTMTTFQVALTYPQYFEVTHRTTLQLEMDVGTKQSVEDEQKRVKAEARAERLEMLGHGAKENAATENAATENVPEAVVVEADSADASTQEKGSTQGAKEDSSTPRYALRYVLWKARYIREDQSVEELTAKYERLSDEIQEGRRTHRFKTTNRLKGKRAQVTCALNNKDRPTVYTDANVTACYIYDALPKTGFHVLGPHTCSLMRSDCWSSSAIVYRESFWKFDKLFHTFELGHGRSGRIEFGIRRRGAREEDNEVGDNYNQATLETLRNALVDFRHRSNPEDKPGRCNSVHHTLDFLPLGLVHQVERLGGIDGLHFAFPADFVISKKKRSVESVTTFRCVSNK